MPRPVSACLSRDLQGDGDIRVDNLQRGTGRDGTEGFRSAARPRAVRRLAVPAVALSVALGVAQMAAAAPSQAATGGSSSRSAIGHVPVLPKGATSAAAPSDSTKLSLDIELNTGHAAELSAYAAGVGDRNSPYYHQYLSPTQVADEFGASSAQIATVEAQLKAAGLTVGSVSSDHMFITASSTVSQAQSAFGVHIAGYKAAGRSFYANTTAPTLPASIAGDVANVAGLDDAAYAVPNIASVGKHPVVGQLSAGKGASANTGTGAKPSYAVNACTEMEQIFSEGNPSLTNGIDYYSSDALSNIYGMTPVVQAGNDGAGVTVAVFELENYDPAGVAELDSCYGHSTSVSEIKVDGGPGNVPANLATNVGVESALDIETIANLAPGVKIVDYAAPNSAAGVVANYQAIVSQDTAQVVSTSWGLCEPDAESSTVQQESTIFQQAAVQGQTVVAASGDEGDTECYNDGSSNTSLQVQDPSSQPYVTAVGGTTMQGLTNPSTTTWNSYFGNYGASGGGVSSLEAAPSYQAGVQASGYSSNCSAAPGCRQVPDVSALADPNDGYVIDEYVNDGVKGDPVGTAITTVGGTSGAAPVWAAIFALSDATTSCRLNGEAGFVNPSLYTAGQGASASSVFSDVTTGNNGISAIGASFGYPATTGYDMSTGWGSPKLAGVMATVCQAPIVSPASYFVPDGPTRLMDTRPDAAHHVGPVTGPVAASGTITLPIGNNAEGDGVPASKVTAVVLNVTAVGATVAGNATVYPDGSARPLASNLNWTAGETIPNLVVVPVTDGSIKIWNNSGGTINFLADLEGYFTSDTTAANISSYVPVTPVRVADTRKTSLVGTVVGPLASDSATAIQVSGQKGLPDVSAITSVVLNVTVTQPTGVNGNLIVYPAGANRPSSSNINFNKGESIPNLVIVPLSSTGAIDIYNNSAGTAQYVVDVQGYFTSGTSGAKYHPLGPVRLLDTRYGQGETSVSSIASDHSLNLPLPSGYSAIIANLTVTQPAGPNGDLDAYPAGGTLPTVSNVNFTKGQTIPNLAFVSSNSGVSLYNHSASTVQALLDLAGYFSAN